ncbi:MAG TPA: amino acid permease, partial [Vicinamibacteria bacterium]|nr:amino acid permease [Vicinamibacteria bacterium]
MRPAVDGRVCENYRGRPMAEINAAEREGGLERELSSWQQSMIAIGGTIGVGLFLGSGATIGLAGPGVVLTYLIAAIPAIAMGFVLAEMASVHPVAGAFGVYCDLYVGRWAGFATRLTYWFAETLAIGAQLTAVGVYFGFWFPQVPGFLFMAGAAGIALSVNALHVGRFGFLESAFSMIKVAAILGFIVAGAALVFGAGSREAIGAANLTADGGLFPNGARGVWLALTLVITSYLGLESVAVTAGEAQRPERTVARALLGTAAALIVLYVLSMAVIVTMSPWRSISETSGTLTGSPFVSAFESVGVPFASSLMNFVVISAAFTAVMSHLYICTRMLFSLSRAGYVPKSIGAVDRRGVPLRALACASVGMAIALALAARGRQVFLPMYGTAVAALLSIWLLIFICHFRFRARLGPARIAALPVRVPLHPLPGIAGIALIVATLAATPWVAGL